MISDDNQLAELAGIVGNASVADKIALKGREALLDYIRDEIGIERVGEGKTVAGKLNAFKSILKSRYGQDFGALRPEPSESSITTANVYLNDIERNEYFTKRLLDAIDTKNNDYYKYIDIYKKGKEDKKAAKTKVKEKGTSQKQIDDTRTLEDLYVAQQAAIETGENLDPNADKTGAQKISASSGDFYTLNWRSYSKKVGRQSPVTTLHFVYKYSKDDAVSSRAGDKLFDTYEGMDAQKLWDAYEQANTEQTTNRGVVKEQVDLLHTYKDIIISHKEVDQKFIAALKVSIRKLAAANNALLESSMKVFEIVRQISMRMAVAAPGTFPIRWSADGKNLELSVPKQAGEKEDEYQKRKNTASPKEVFDFFKDKSVASSFLNYDQSLCLSDMQVATKAFVEGDKNAQKAFEIPNESFGESEELLATKKGVAKHFVSSIGKKIATDFSNAVISKNSGKILSIEFSIGDKVPDTKNPAKANVMKEFVQKEGKQVRDAVPVETHNVILRNMSLYLVGYYNDIVRKYSDYTPFSVSLAQRNIASAVQSSKSGSSDAAQARKMIVDSLRIKGKAADVLVTKLRFIRKPGAWSVVYLTDNNTVVGVHDATYSISAVYTWFTCMEAYMQGKPLKYESVSIFAEARAKVKKDVADDVLDMGADFNTALNNLRTAKDQFVQDANEIRDAYRRFESTLDYERVANATLAAEKESSKGADINDAFKDAFKTAAGTGTKYLGVSETPAGDVYISDIFPVLGKSMKKDFFVFDTPEGTVNLLEYGQPYRDFRSSLKNFQFTTDGKKETGELQTQTVVQAAEQIDAVISDYLKRVGKKARVATSKEEARLLDLLNQQLAGLTGPKKMDNAIKFFLELSSSTYERLYRVTNRLLRSFEVLYKEVENINKMVSDKQVETEKTFDYEYLKSALSSGVEADELLAYNWGATEEVPSGTTPTLTEELKKEFIIDVSKLPSFDLTSRGLLEKSLKDLGRVVNSFLWQTNVNYKKTGDDTEEPFSYVGDVKGKEVDNKGNVLTTDAQGNPVQAGHLSAMFGPSRSQATLRGESKMKKATEEFSGIGGSQSMDSPAGEVESSLAMDVPAVPESAPSDEFDSMDIGEDAWDEAGSAADKLAEVDTKISEAEAAGADAADIAKMKEKRDGLAEDLDALISDAEEATADAESDNEEDVDTDVADADTDELEVEEPAKDEPKKEESCQVCNESVIFRALQYNTRR